MATKITRDIIESYLNCKYKGHLKLTGESGTPSDYEAMTTAARQASREEAINKLVAHDCPHDACQGRTVTATTLKQGAPLLADATLEEDTLSLRLDALKRADGASKLGNHHYLPVLHKHGNKVGRHQKLLLAIFGLALAQAQELRPPMGLVTHGPAGKLRKVRLDAKLYRKAAQVLDELKRLQAGGEPTRLTLNNHCQLCEFRQECRKKAVEADDISLLAGLGEKELKKYNRKGLFTLTQLAHTFRPRRKGKRAVQRTSRRYYALQALAIRDKRVYVFGTPELSKHPVTIYLDMEGLPDEGFVYLIGMIVVQSGTETRHSFWADRKEQEQEIFERFLTETSRYGDFVIFSYGSYERTFIKRMRKVTSKTEQVDRVLNSLVNLLSVIYTHLYFPCHSNGLKEVAGYLGFSWSEPDPSGLQSIAWRKWWEAGHAEEWKDRLTTYNMDDCAALKMVAEFVSRVDTTTPSKEVGPAKDLGTPIARVEELDQLGTITRRGKIEFFHPDFEFVNKCAHFDYQRQHVYVRKSKTLKRKRVGTRKWLNQTLRISQKIRIVDQNCPSCGGMEVFQWERGKRVTGLSTRKKRAFDLVFTASGIKRRVIECRTSIHECSTCGKVFIPDRYDRLAKHFHGLLSWVTYQQVSHRIKPNTLKELLKDLFRLAVCQQEINEFKSMMARSYQLCYDGLLAKVLSGKVLHIDETQVTLRHSKGYVWVFTTTEEVVYMYRPTREGDFLLELLKDFHGVLVSDFYAAYDAIACPQQKCLIHLMRDMNQELLNSPFDTELQSITGPFGTLLRAIVADVDRYGLKRNHLIKHERNVTAYFESVVTRVFSSDAAEALRVRLVKNRDKLFTFIEYDGVAGNNNNAENAIRQFAYYREEATGLLSEAGLKDYLVLLSICQTCRYKGVSFLKFLLSRETDMEAFCQGRQKRRQLPLLETYPAGVVRPDFGGCNRGKPKSELAAAADQKAEPPTTQ